MAANPASPLRYAIGGMIAMAVAMGIGRFVYTPILPGMMDELRLTASDAGLIASANYLGYLVGAFAAAGGWASGRERPIMLTALAASGLLAALMAAGEGMVPFLAVRFLAGVASAFVMVFLSTIVFSHLAAAGRGDLQAVHFAGVALGISVSSLMTGALVIADSQWFAGWIWAAVLSAVGFAAAAVLVDRGPLVQGAAVREPPLPKSGALNRVIVAYGLFGLGYIVTATFLVAIVRAGDGGRLFESAVWLVTGLAGIPSVYLWGRLARRIGLTAAFAVGCVVEAVGVAASVGLGGHAGPLVGGALLGGTFIAVTAIGLQMGRLLAPAAPRRALALMTVSFGTGQILGPLAAGLLADRTGGYSLPSLAAAAMLLAAALVALSAGEATKSP
ncbi:MAG: YbfB/YjiJ family MFS transporter [Rhizobiaceae bacterium]|nr:MAG: YbfB/YjiJ family MFS transporter [Rhizobiaceae bacterium]